MFYNSIYIYVKYTLYPLSNPKNPSNSQANEGIGSPHLITRSATLRWPNSARSSATAGSRDRAAPGELAAEKIVGKSWGSIDVKKNKMGKNIGHRAT
jgi:hypothetical protein